MTATIGANVGLYVDLVARVWPGDVIETQGGRRYDVLTVRVQVRGKHAGREHLRAVVITAYQATDALNAGRQVHRIRWYARGRRKR